MSVGAYWTLYSLFRYSPMALRSSSVPGTGVYLWKPPSMAFLAASQMGAGVLKSGSPAPKLRTSTPSSCSFLALASMARVIDGATCFIRSEISISHSRFQPSSLGKDSNNVKLIKRPDSGRIERKDDRRLPVRRIELNVIPAAFRVNVEDRTRGAAV